MSTAMQASRGTVTVFIFVESPGRKLGDFFFKRGYHVENLAARFQRVWLCPAQGFCYEHFWRRFSGGWEPFFFFRGAWVSAMTG